jgi:T5orf172 domain
MSGYVYALDNPCFRTNASQDLREVLYPIKIGMTEKDPITRAAELYTTSVPSPFEVVWYQKLDNAYEAEQYIHRALARSRLAKNREFFWLNPHKLVEILDELVYDFQHQDEWSSPFGDDVDF